ncbi:hypothetical protein NDU88_003648 [Pleurodeles waltl]|uniref:Uncharacterized protein n=1 Tax=Pleurodeles waltl TaxID=8319 RepID=A0AAV7NIP5_PLEWA|nr:hypothetical protein NDU88_003648 [Pleurodeles waltl]
MFVRSLKQPVRLGVYGMRGCIRGSSPSPPAALVSLRTCAQGAAAAIVGPLGSSLLRVRVSLPSGPRASRCVKVIKMDGANKVVQALKVLQDEGREDLLWEGVIEQAWVGLRRPKGVSSEGVVAAVMACSSPMHSGKKFRQKSAAGRKARVSPDRALPEEQAMPFDSPAVSATASQGGIRFARRAGASIRQRVLSRGRGAPLKHAVTGMGRVVVRQERVHARLDAHTAVQRRNKLGSL